MSHNGISLPAPGGYGLKLNNWALSAFAILTLVGCGCGGNTQQSNDLNTPTQPGGAGRPASEKVGHHVLAGVVFDDAGTGDKSFNDSAFRGTELAKKDLNVDIRTVESLHVKDYEANLNAMADAGCDVVFAIGNDQDKAVTAVAPKYPNVKFAIVDA